MWESVLGGEGEVRGKMGWCEKVGGGLQRCGEGKVGRRPPSRCDLERKGRCGLER